MLTVFVASLNWKQRNIHAQNLPRSLSGLPENIWALKPRRFSRHREEIHKSLDLEMFSHSRHSSVPIHWFSSSFLCTCNAHWCFWETPDANTRHPLNPSPSPPALSTYLPVSFLAQYHGRLNYAVCRKPQKALHSRLDELYLRLENVPRILAVLFFCCHSKFCCTCSMELFRPNRKLTESRLKSFQTFYIESKWFLAAPKKHRIEHVTM